MATREEVIASVAFRLGNVRGLNTLIGQELDATINRLEANDFLPWFLLSEDNTYVTTKGESRVPIPDGFLKEYDEGALYVQHPTSGLWIELPKRSQQTNRRQHQINDQVTDPWAYTGIGGVGLTEGCPQSYSLTNQYFRLFPVPDKEYTLELLFYRKSSTLFDKDVWYKQAPELLIAETASMMMLARQDKRYQEYKALAELERRKLVGRHEERDVSNQDLKMGGDY